MPGRDRDVWPIDPALSRRRVLRAAGAFGLAATSLPALLAACGGGDDASSSAASSSAGASSEAAPATSAPATSEAATDTGAATSAPATTAPEPTSSGRRCSRHQDGRTAPCRPRRRRQGRVVQPGPRLVVHRCLARLQPLRPADPGQPRLLAVAGARARVDARRDLHRLGGQAAARRRLARRLAVHRRRRHLHAAADGRRGTRLARRRAERQARPGQEERRPDGGHPAARARTRGCRTPFVQQNTVIVKNGTKDFTKPVGTGPFMFQEFTVGERSLCVEERELLGGGQAVRRRVGGHLDRRQRRAAERPARAARST